MDKTSRYFIITSDSSELTSTMSGRASASGVKHLWMKEHSLMKANNFFLKNSYYHCIPPLLFTKSYCLALCSSLQGTVQHCAALVLTHYRVQHLASAGTIILVTNPDRTADRLLLCTPRHTRVWVVPLPRLGEALAFLVGTVLWSRHCTAGQSSCEGDECAIRRIYRRIHYYRVLRSRMKGRRAELGFFLILPGRGKGSSQGGCNLQSRTWLLGVKIFWVRTRETLR